MLQRLVRCGMALGPQVLRDNLRLLDAFTHVSQELTLSLKNVRERGALGQILVTNPVHYNSTDPNQSHSLKEKDKEKDKTLDSSTASLTSRAFTSRMGTGKLSSRRDGSLLAPKVISQLKESENNSTTTGTMKTLSGSVSAQVVEDLSQLLMGEYGRDGQLEEQELRAERVWGYRKCIKSNLRNYVSGKLEQKAAMRENLRQIRKWRVVVSGGALGHGGIMSKAMASYIGYSQQKGVRGVGIGTPRSVESTKTMSFSSLVQERPSLKKLVYALHIDGLLMCFAPELYRCECFRLSFAETEREEQSGKSGRASSDVRENGVAAKNGRERGGEKASASKKGHGVFLRVHVSDQHGDEVR